MKKLFFSISIIALALSCTKETIIEIPQTIEPPTEEPQLNSTDLNFSVSFASEWQNTVYPSLILGLANYTSQQGQSFDFIQYDFTTPKANTDVKIELSGSTINKTTVYQDNFSIAGNNNSVWPSINWDYEILKDLDQPGNVDLTFKAFVDGKELDNKTLKLNYRSVSECVYGFLDASGNFIDTSFMFAAYVNENDPLIDNFLKNALDSRVVDSFTGYLSSDQNITSLQAAALWYELQSKGVKYSSITETSNSSSKVFSQDVRFFNEVYNSEQANCVDGTVFLSSILKKIGIDPLLVLVPGHMYLAYYIDAQKSGLFLLETTMVGNVDLNEITFNNNQLFMPQDYQRRVSQQTIDALYNGSITLDYLKREISYHSFLEASEINGNLHIQNIEKFNDTSDKRHQIFDISKLREIVQPISN